MLTEFSSCNLPPLFLPSTTGIRDAILLNNNKNKTFTNCVRMYCSNVATSAVLRGTAWTRHDEDRDDRS